MRSLHNATLTVMLAVVFPSDIVRSGEPAPAGPEAFFNVVREKARALAEHPYQKPPAPPLPDFLRNLNYESYRLIRFRPDQSLWRTDSKFRLQFFHPGYLFREPVRVNVLADGQTNQVRFSPEMFDYNLLTLQQPVPNDLYFAGLRLVYPLQSATPVDEVAAFLGCTYFRPLGANQIYGASARGLAVDTGEPSGEEFPYFTEFWLEKPAPNTNHVRLFALLESPRASGAFQFVIQPGSITVTEVQASLFLREEVKKLGLAPLTSMYFFGKNRTRYYPDIRPEVHDSDGLLLATRDQQWLWRPLDNPQPAHRITTFTNVAGFGLMQRERNPDHYQDRFKHFEARPSYWITPEGDWPPGRVELVEIPSPAEWNDNIVAYFVPELKLPPRQEFQFRYRLSALLTDPERPPPAFMRVQGTRIQPGFYDKERFTFFVDFQENSPRLDRTGLSAQTQISRGKIENVSVSYNEVVGVWRAAFDVASRETPTDLRLWLQQDNQVVSETWVYHWAGP